MTSGILVLAQLLRSAGLGPIAPVDTAERAAVATVAAPRPLVYPDHIDWNALRGVGQAPDTGRVRQRKKSVEYTGFYHARLSLHRWLSFAMIPLFAGSYITGDQILKHSTAAPKWARDLHRPLATGSAVVFSLNTVTGLWNLWDSRKDPAGRTKRVIHSLMFLAADVGFFYAGTRLADDAESSEAKRREHRNVALASMGVSVTSWAMMILF